MLPAEVVARIHKEGDIIGLMMLDGSLRRTFYFRVETAEGPNDLVDYSLGAASALTVAGTNWQEITDSAGRYHLEPENENVIYGFFFGVSPGQAWVYRRYPGGTDLNSLLGTRAIGSGVGHIDGWKSPYRTPSPFTEMYTLKGQHPSFLGYNPFAEPSSITVRLNFFVTRYDVTALGVNPMNVQADESRLVATEDVRRKAKVSMVGGHTLIPAPSWVQQLIGRR